MNFIIFIIVWGISTTFLYLLNLSLNHRINELEKWMKMVKKEQDEILFSKVEIYTDGSYINSSHIVGYAYIVVDEDGSSFAINGSYTDHLGYCNMRNVGGELLAVQAAVTWALSHHVKDLTIVHDYLGVSEWVTGQHSKKPWNANNELVKVYQDFMLDAMIKMNIRFRWVKSHSGHVWNEEADRVAKLCAKNRCSYDYDAFIANSTP